MPMRLAPTTLLCAAAIALAGCATASEPPSLLATAPGAQLTATEPVAPAPATGIDVETDYYSLPNGLKVVLAPEHSVPTVTVAVYYGIGFRIEPRDRTGFAHLFEHLMFQGSANAPKGQFDKIIYNAGGVNNGSTRFDYTNYYEVVPSNALEAVLWLEADRMARPDINQEVLANQQGVVVNEVNLNVHNQPYGGWPWLHMPQLANENWYNAHNFYGELDDLKAASTQDAREFFQSFYRPNNAVLVIAGDFQTSRAKQWVQRYFGGIPRGEPVVIPDISEPRQTAEKSRVHPDERAPRPAFTAAWHVPPRGTPEWYAMGIIDQILAQGQDSRLYEELVRERGITSGVQAGINIGLGNMFNYNGPMIWTVGFIHDPSTSREEITGVLDQVIEDLRSRPVSQEELDRARTKLRSNLYNVMDPATRFGLVDLLAVGAMWEDDPEWLERLESGFEAVTPDLVLSTAREYLRPTNRSILIVEPGAAPANQTGAAQ